MKKIRDRWGPVLTGAELDAETLNIRRAELKRQEESDAQRTLALQVIAIGYKMLARGHRDKGGSREAKARLNAVRRHLKQYVEDGFLNLRRAWRR